MGWTKRWALVALLAFSPSLAVADFRPVKDQAEFNTLIADRKLTRVGISLSVTPAGEIQGRAFGRRVSGDWNWRDGYFCRNLKWGDVDFGFNCQQVERKGRTLRFTSDQGTGDHADLQLR